MPDIDNIEIPLYQANQPYHYSVDNLPFDAIKSREDLINAAVEASNTALAAAAGTAGTLDTRLDQSLHENGNLISSAVDTALHNIGAHADGNYEVSDTELLNYKVSYPLVENPVPFVRMLQAERTKLASVANGATDVTLDFVTPTGNISITSGLVTFQSSTTLNWYVDPGTKFVQAELVTTYSNPHKHYDNIIPASKYLTPDYKNYNTGITSPFIVDSLKVFINGVRIFPGTSVYYPTFSDTPVLKLNSFTEYGSGLGFELLNSITEDDIIFVDFEVSLV